MVNFIFKKYYNVNTHILIERKRYCEKLEKYYELEEDKLSMWRSTDK